MLSRNVLLGRVSLVALPKGQVAFLSKAPEHLLIERVGAKKNVALVTFNRPKALNALFRPLMGELAANMAELDNDDSIGAIVLTGGVKHFAAGADIKEFLPREFVQVWDNDYGDNWKKVRDTTKPIIAAANGFVFGGGCELMMQCDIAYAGKSALFAQPEISIGTIPGQGATQRWPRFAGKSLAMEINLTGCRISAQEAKEAGIISKVLDDGQPVIDAAIATAEKISEQSPFIVRMVKEAVNVAYETSLQEGLRFERRLFHATFATNDRREGMSSFVAKKKPNWTNS